MANQGTPQQQQQMITTEGLLKHPTLNISAPPHYWSAAGYQPFSNTDTVGHGNSPHKFDSILMQGIEATGTNDHRVIVWALAEHQRRTEEQTRSTALAREADAIRELAQSLRATSEDEVLKKLLGRLSDRTQYAIRQQLGM